MKKKLFFSLIIIWPFTFTAFAQKKKVQFYSINTFGAVGGESGLNSAFQTVNGIQFVNWFSGIGIGIDNYRYKTLPLFFDTRKYFGTEKRAFIYGDLGYNFSMKNKPGKEIFGYDTYHFNGGVYTDLGMGYNFPVSKKSSFVFSLGHSYKKVQSKIGLNNCGFGGPCAVNYTNYKFSYGRMILKAGLVF